MTIREKNGPCVGVSQTFVFTPRGGNFAFEGWLGRDSNTSTITICGGNFAWEGRTFGRTGGVLRGDGGSAGTSGPARPVGVIARVCGVTSGAIGSSGGAKPVWLVASATGGSSCAISDITGAVEPDRMCACFARGERPPSGVA